MPTSNDRNPLLDIRFQVPFDRIQAGHVEPAIDQLLEQAGARQRDLAANPGPYDFKGTLLALDGMTEGLDYAMGVVKHLESVATSPELRAAYNAVEPKVSAYYSRIPLDPGLWSAVKAYSGTDEAKSLAGTRKRFLVKTLDTFRRHGAELDPEGKRKLEALDVELARLTTKFAENVLDATNAFELVIMDPAELAGLPASAIEAARQSAASKGREGWRFTLQAPSYIALMTYMDNAAVRERVYRAHASRAASGPLDNRENATRILELRGRKAGMLGYSDFAALVLEDRMAHTGGRARAFLDELREKTEPHFHRENRELREFRRGLEGGNAPDPRPWDIAYYAEKQRAALYDFDEEALRPYFPLESVMKGLFEVVERLYGIRITEETGFPTWDPSVRCYSVSEAGGALLGAFYADWYPRDNKRGGAWMDALITGISGPEGQEPHLGLICGNLTPPLAGKPALLTHREVETVFHEFGHLLHHILSRVEIRGLAGTNVAWDFVELPSQIMENWCWEREALDLFARHYKTGAPIPGDLFEKMKRARNYRAANAQMRQLGFAIVDLMLHMNYLPERDGEIVAYSNKILQAFSPAPLTPDYAMIAAFTHLFANPVGYGSGYYSYKWAEVLDADAFTRFRDNGIFNRETGRLFREKILAKGDSGDPAELYRDFMGRDPNPAALLERAGLVSGR